MKTKLFTILIILNLFFTGCLFAQELEEPEFNQEEPLESNANEFPEPEPVTSQQRQILPSPQIKTPLSNVGNKISLEIKGMDVVEVLKMLASRAAMNLIIGKNVTGRVTLFLKDVEVWDAFEIILLANDLAYEKKNGIINVMSQRDYELLYGERYQDKKQVKIIPLRYAKAADLSRALNQLKTNIGRIVVDESSNTLVLIDTPEKLKDMEDFIDNTDLPIQTRVFALNYGQAEKISPKIQEAITKGVGTIRIDERTNKIVITDYPQKLDEIAKIVSAFDEKTPQVLIDAQIIEIKPSDEFYLGVDWDYFLKEKAKLVGNFPVGGRNILKLGLAASGESVSEKGDYKGILDILRKIGDIKILSSPRIVVSNNQEAKILVGKKQSYGSATTSQGASGNIITSIEIKTVESGIKLSVTPTINRDGFVTMKIKPEISDTSIDLITVEDKRTGAPKTDTSEAETTVMVKDGVTLIIGGLKKDKRVKTVNKIPLLGDIPVLGLFFRSTVDTFETTELVILLTPHIMSGETSFTDFAEIKPKEGEVVRMVKGEIIREKISKSKEKEPLLESKAISEYYQLLSDKISQFAEKTLPVGKKGKVEINFRLSSKGGLIQEPQVLMTTDAYLIPFAMQAVKNASPFSPFPADLKKPEETFRIILKYE